MRAIARAHVKTDKIDAAVLARIHACGFLPEVWIPDERTEMLRRQVTRRTQIVRQRTRLKSAIHAFLHAHLIPPCPAADPFGRKRRAWLPKRGVDLAGQIVAVIALVCVAGASTQAGTLGWSHPLTLGGLIMGCAFFSAFLGIEARCEHPMMPLDLFGSAAFSTALFVGAIINFVYYGLVFVFRLFFQLVQGKDALATGLSFVPLTVLIMFVNVVAGNLIARFGLRLMMLTGLTMATVGYVAMLSIRADSSYAAIAPTFIAAGVGIALVVPLIMTAALSGTGPSRAGIGAGVLNSARQIGGAVGMNISIAAAGIALMVALLIAFTFMPSEEDQP